MKDILRISLPLTLWLASFSAIYGLHGLLCSGRWPVPTDDGRLILVAAAVAAVALQVALLIALRARSYGSPFPFVQRVSVMLAIAALIAAAWTVIPVATISMCL